MSASSTIEDKTVFTTGEAAEICKVSQQTIIRCFDNGRLKGFRVPGSRFRRIPKSDLLRFMRVNKIPTEVIEEGQHKLLIVGTNYEFNSGIIAHFSEDDEWKVISAKNHAEAIPLIFTERPEFLVIHPFDEVVTGFFYEILSSIVSFLKGEYKPRIVVSLCRKMPANQHVRKPAEQFEILRYSSQTTHKEVINLLTEHAVAA